LKKQKKKLTISQLILISVYNVNINCIAVKTHRFPSITA
jgi:hypothetical protein